MSTWSTRARRLFLTLRALAVTLLVAQPASAAEWQAPAGYSYKSVPGCPFPTKAYSACEDQMAVFKAARERAARNGKLLFVIFGADWCPFCRSLDRLTPTADVLGHKDLAGRFEMVRIAASVIAEGRKMRVPSGVAVMDRILARTPGISAKGLPFLAVIDPRDDARAFTTNSDDLEGGGGEPSHDPAKVRALLIKAEQAVR
jgi:thiol-disulfide isomerase/thioredoxin